MKNEYHIKQILSGCRAIAVIAPTKQNLDDCFSTKKQDLLQLFNSLGIAARALGNWQPATKDIFPSIINEMNAWHPSFLTDQNFTIEFAKDTLPKILDEANLSKLSQMAGEDNDRLKHLYEHQKNYRDSLFEVYRGMKVRAWSILATAGVLITIYDPFKDEGIRFLPPLLLILGVLPCARLVFLAYSGITRGYTYDFTKEWLPFDLLFSSVDLMQKEGEEANKIQKSAKKWLSAARLSFPISLILAIMVHICWVME